MDKYFRVDLLERTPNPQQLIWMSAHQCVSADAVADEPNIPDEAAAGVSVIKHLLAGNRGHYSPLEAPQISFNVIGFPHSVMQQVRTHRIGVHFSVQSFRYTGDDILKAAEGQVDEEEVFYLRPLGHYTDREGKRYEYTEARRALDRLWLAHAAQHYQSCIEFGMSEEHARGMIPFDVRQNWVMSLNVRSFMHVLDLRWKADAQLECQQLCDLMWVLFQEWVPDIAEWYEVNRAKKARLSP